MTSITPYEPKYSTQEELDKRAEWRPFGSWSKLEPNKLNIEATVINTVFFTRITEKNKAVRKVLARRVDKLIGADIFMLLFKQAPVIKAEPPDPALAEWLRHQLDSPEVEKMRRKTTGDKNLAAAGAVRLFRELMRKRESDLKAIIGLASNLETVEAMVESNAGIQNAVDAIKEVQLLVSKQLQRGETADSRWWDEENEEWEDSVVGPAADKVLEDIEIVESLAQFDRSGAEGFGYNPNNASERVLNGLLDDKMMDKITQSDQLRTIMKIVGRMKLIMETAKSQAKHVSPVPVGIEYGDDVSRVLPSTLALLALPETIPLFYQGLRDRTLMQYKPLTKPNQGMGPLVCVVDFSGSMMGEPENYAKALFIAMAQMAVAQHRNIWWVPFADNAAKPQLIQSSTDVVNMVTKRVNKIGGGTVFQAALDAAMLVIDSEKIQNKADIMLISDGYGDIWGPYADKFHAWKMQHRVRLFGLNLFGRWSGRIAAEMDASAAVDRSGLRRLTWLNNMAPMMVAPR